MATTKRYGWHEPNPEQTTETCLQWVTLTEGFKSYDGARQWGETNGDVKKGEVFVYYEPQHPSKVATIGTQTAKRYRNDVTAFDQWGSERDSYQTSEVPANLQHVDNAMRGELEQAEFAATSPQRYFAYWSNERVGKLQPSYQIWLTTFTGERIAKVSSGYNEWTDNFGGTRVSFQALGINGVWYFGTCYKSSSGDYYYCRMKAMKRNPNTGAIQLLDN